MKYFLKVTTPSLKGTYLQIYKSFYIPGKGCRNSSFQKVGYVEELKKTGIEDPIAYYQDVVKELNKELETKELQQIGDYSVTKNLGYFLIKIVFDYLGLDKDLNIMCSNYKSHYKMSDLVRTLVYAQFVNPGSKLQAFEKVIPELYDCESFSYDQILDGINFIGHDVPKFVELINHFISLKWDRNLDTAFFDCTNYYFEIDEQDDIRRFGPSKEERHCPIIGQALMLDADMIPIDTSFYPGNQSEKPYIRQSIEDMKNRNNVTGRVIQVADKGLNCARNIYAAVKEANDGYIFSKSIHGKNLSETEKKWLFLEDDELNQWTEIKDSQNNLLFKYKETKQVINDQIVPYDVFEYKCKINPEDSKEEKFTVKEKRILTFNPALARKQRKEINKEVDKLKSKINMKAILREELGDSCKYVNIETKTVGGEKVKIGLSLKQDKIDEDLRMAGYNLLVTSEINADPVKIYKTYHQLWRIEQSFRIMKTYLEARPVFLEKYESIYGHFLICYYALVIERLIELKIFNDEVTPDEIFTFIRNYRVTQNIDGSFINNATKSDFYLKVKAKLGLSNLGNLYLSKADVKTIKNSCF